MEGGGGGRRGRRGGVEGESQGGEERITPEGEEFFKQVS